MVASDHALCLFLRCYLLSRQAGFSLLLDVVWQQLLSPLANGGRRVWLGQVDRDLVSKKEEKSGLSVSVALMDVHWHVLSKRSL